MPAKEGGAYFATPQATAPGAETGGLETSADFQTTAASRRLLFSGFAAQKLARYKPKISFKDRI